MTLKWFTRGLQVSEQEIAKLAYSKWEAAGSQHEDANPYWLEAERELLALKRESESKRIRFLLKCGVAAVPSLYLALGLLHYWIVPPTGSVQWRSDHAQIKAFGTNCMVQSDRRIVRCWEFDMVLAKPLPRY